MDRDIQHVINLFPDREIRIRQLWPGDEDFRELAQDYTLCLETLARLSVEAAAPTQIAEYQSLRRRLELEIEIKTQEIQPRETDL